MTVEERDVLRLTVDVPRDGGGVVPAGTVGTVVDVVHAPDQYAVDVQVDGEYDNVAVAADQIEPA